MSATHPRGLVLALKRFWPLTLILVVATGLVGANAIMLHRKQQRTQAPTLAPQPSALESMGEAVLPGALDFPEGAALAGFLAAFGDRIEELEEHAQQDRARQAAMEHSLSKKGETLEDIQQSLRELRTTLDAAQSRATDAEQTSEQALGKLQAMLQDEPRVRPDGADFPTILGGADRPDELVAQAQPPRPTVPKLKRLQWGPVDPAPQTPPAAAPPKRFLHLPAGAFADAVLLSGVYAPVGEQAQPLPVLLRLNEAYQGPNARRIPLRDAFLIGKASGDANSERAIIQLERLSLVLPSGEAFETQVSGYVVAADGHQGVPGRYQWNIGRVLPGQFAAGGLAGAAEALAEGERSTVVTEGGGVVNAVTGNAARRAGLKGLSAGMQKFSDIFDQRLAEIHSAVVVHNGARVSAVMLGGVTIEGYQIEEDTRDAAYRTVD